MKTATIKIPATLYSGSDSSGATYAGDPPVIGRYEDVAAALDDLRKRQDERGGAWLAIEGWIIEYEPDGTFSIRAEPADEDFDPDDLYDENGEIRDLEGPHAFDIDELRRRFALADENRACERGRLDLADDRG